MKKEFKISTLEPPDVKELLVLYKQAHWALNRSRKDVERLLVKTDVFVTIRDAGKLIGFGRALSDGIFRAILDDIIVEERYRGLGVGAIIVETLMAQLTDIEEVLLHAEKDLEGFYDRFGFKPFHGLTMNFRKDWK